MTPWARTKCASARMGGICGSDLHYFHEGRVGRFALRVRVGQRVAVKPSLPCNACDFCLQSMGNHCRNMRFFGSAALMPRVQGVFKQSLRVPKSQSVPVPDDRDISLAAMGEPLAVALHAVQRATPITGRRVLISGAGLACEVIEAPLHLRPPLSTPGLCRHCIACIDIGLRILQAEASKANILASTQHPNHQSMRELDRVSVVASRYVRHPLVTHLIRMTAQEMKVNEITAA